MCGKRKPGVQKRSNKTPSPSSISCAPYSTGGVPRRAWEYVQCYPGGERRPRRSMEGEMEGIGTASHRVGSLPVSSLVCSLPAPLPWWGDLPVAWLLLLLHAPETEPCRYAIWMEDGRWCVEGHCRWVVSAVGSLNLTVVSLGASWCGVVVLLAWIPWAVSWASFRWLPWDLPSWV